jgi:hypothetical protein
MELSTSSVSQHLSLTEVISRLSQSSLVDGIAEFGSHTAEHFSPNSDYDLLILITQLPFPVFQMLTSIHERLADIVLVDTQTADRLLASSEPPTTLFDTLFARKMQTAHIHFDRAGRLQCVQDRVTHSSWQAIIMTIASRTPEPAVWFWQSFGLLQLERMVQTHDLVHLLAVDMLLTACLSATWRSYFDVHALPWEGEKAALRYWMEHDTGYFQAVQACLAAPNRNERLSAYRSLVEQTIKPIANILEVGETAVVLAQAEHEEHQVQTMVQFWNNLFAS